MEPLTHNLSVNWDAGELRPAPRKKQPNKREMFYPCTCGNCGSVRWLRRADARKGSICRSCHCSQIGKKGYATTVSRYGKDFAVERTRKHRLDHPTQPERMVEGILIRMGANYAREYVWEGQTRKFVLDFVLLEGELPIAAIEVNGWVHENRPERMERDRKLEREFPLPLLWVPANDIRAEVIDVFRWSTI